MNTLFLFPHVHVLLHYHIMHMDDMFVPIFLIAKYNMYTSGKTLIWHFQFRNTSDCRSVEMNTNNTNDVTELRMVVAGVQMRALLLVTLHSGI